MKKLLLSITALCFVAAATAQLSITSQGGNTDISGTNQYKYVDPEEGLTYIIFHVENNTGATKNLKIQRRLLSARPQISDDIWSDQVCWGVVGDPFGGTCYITDDDETTWTSPSLEFTPGSEGELKPQIQNLGNITGDFTIRYYVMEGTSALDSIDVHWTSQVVSVKEAPEVSISVYPNPATSYLTIAPEGFDGTYTVRMTDVLGKVIYDERAAGTKKVDVSDFRNGVYLVTVMSNGTALQTKRIVVKH